MACDTVDVDEATEARLALRASCPGIGVPELPVARDPAVNFRRLFGGEGGTAVRSAKAPWYAGFGPHKWFG